MMFLFVQRNKANLRPVGRRDGPGTAGGIAKDFALGDATRTVNFLRARQSAAMSRPPRLFGYGTQQDVDSAGERADNQGAFVRKVGRMTAGVVVGFAHRARQYVPQRATGSERRFPSARPDLRLTDGPSEDIREDLHR
jgi:hypothetical protein